MKSAPKIVGLLSVALILVGCSVQSNAQRAEAGSIADAQIVAKDLISGESRAFKISVQRGFQYVIAHSYPAYLHLNTAKACMDEWISTNQTYWEVPDYGTLMADKHYSLIHKVAGKWSYSGIPIEGTTYTVFAQLYDKDKNHPVPDEYGANLHFNVMNGKAYLLTILCG